jgi:cyclopropane-fatty-acyl-phospholipid synthase
MSQMMTRALGWSELGWVPKPIVRHGIRKLIKLRLDEISAYDCESNRYAARSFQDEMRNSAVTVLTDKANEQHYEVPPEFFENILGPRLKYSACYWDDETKDLEQAERNALRISCERARLRDGQRILALGCGWGSLTVWMAEHYPNATITAVTNSADQHAYLENRLSERGITNVSILRRDVAKIDLETRFDRVVSIEMFEHVRNFEALFARISRWLEPDGFLFMHIFCHRSVPYPFIKQSDSDWMSEHFFSGGMMPSDDLPLRFQRDLEIVDQWRWSGEHYARTARAWLDNLNHNRNSILEIFARTYGAGDAGRWWNRWWMFIAACEELFGYDNGQEWWVSHYLLKPR